MMKYQEADVSHWELLTWAGAGADQIGWDLPFQAATCPLKILSGFYLGVHEV